MRAITLNGLVGTAPEARHGQNADYVKFRLGTLEFGENDTWWCSVFCYGKTAKLVLDKVKVGDHLLISGTLLPPRETKGTDLSISAYDFQWLPRETRKISDQSEDVGDAFDFTSFDEIPERPL